MHLDHHGKPGQRGFQKHWQGIGFGVSGFGIRRILAPAVEAHTYSKGSSNSSGSVSI